MQVWQKFKQEWQRSVCITPNNLLYDRSLLWLFVVLILIGLIMVTSASIPVGVKNFHDPFYFAKRDMAYACVSFFIFYYTVRIPMERWEKWHVKIFIIAIVLLFLVLMPGIGKAVYGAKRWIGIGGINFQPAEFAKFALICFLSSYFHRHYNEVRDKKLSAGKPFIVMAILSAVLLLQPDFGSTVMLFAITFGLLFIVGARKRQFVVLSIIAVLLGAWLIITASYRLKRFTGFLDPFKDPYGTGFQLTNSLMAFGRGEITGEGLGNSIQKLQYLPEAHTDFVMAIAGEELGLIGIIVIISLLGLLVMRALKIGKESLLLEQRFKGFFAFGIAFQILGQGFINLGVTLGMLPTKGLTFPLISYGGSSLVMMAISIAILLRIDHENRLMRGGQAHLKDS
ncbi:MAG: putative lipid II flippase FtsW [Pasteurellaceae bacterium]|nr:putative lipid II flippase FtsW [Pasteurellaceae bacterium]